MKTDELTNKYNQIKSYLKQVDIEDDDKVIDILINEIAEVLNKCDQPECRSCNIYSDILTELTILLKSMFNLGKNVGMLDESIK